MGPAGYPVLVPQFESALEAKKRYMSLRDLVDQRRVRDLQVRRLELQEQEAAREQEELRNVTDLLRTNPKATPQEIFSVSPSKGPGLVKGLYEAGKAQFEARKSQADFAESERQRGRKVQQEMVDQMRSLLQLPEAARPAAYQKMLQSNIANKYLPAEAADQPMPTPEEIRQQYAQFHGTMALQDLDDKIASSARAKEQEADRAARAVYEREKLRQETTGTQPVTQYQRAQLDQSARANSPDEIIAMLNDPRTPPDRKPALKATLDQMLQYHTQVRPSVVTAIPGLADAVLQNPNLWDNLTPSAKTEIAPEIARRGGGAIFGKPLSEGAITKLSDSRSAVGALRDLREVLKANEQYIGPLSGLQAVNPYSEARKAQANIDLVRQRVGKALEGGVLRKEDEEKYKKILATLTDVPSTAIYKVDQLVDTLTRDIETFTEEQKKAGRRVSPAETEPAKPKPSGTSRPPLDSFYRK